jgi:NADPH:quinone reductase-like Zn-dependent oxidoreductase
VPEPVPGRHDALVAVQAFSLNRGELRSFRNNEEGWIPGQDISGIVLRQAAEGSGPPAGAHIVALMDGQNARLQSFFSFSSGPEEQFAPDLALLVSRSGTSRTPQTGPEPPLIKPNLVF